MVKIITTDTDHPFSFHEGCQTFISKPHPTDEHAPGPLRLGAEFSFEYVQICRWRSVLMPLSFQQVKVIIQPEAAVKRVVSLLRGSEYKRRQGPPGLRLSARSFGSDWCYPVTQRYTEDF